jgi:hypothetical protein
MAIVHDEARRTLADAGVGASVAGLIFSHIVEVNEVLQFILLVVSIASGFYAIRYYRANIKK